MVAPGTSAKTAAPSNDGTASHCAKIRVFIVEPQKLFQTGLLALLAESNDFSVVGAASSGFEALTAAGSTQPSVVVIGEGLPDLTPAQLILRMCNEVPGARALVLSSQSSWRTVIGVFRAGAWGYVAKERSIDDLKAALQVIALGRRFVDAETGGMLAHAWSELPGTSSEIALASLSRREAEVFRLLLEGKNTKEITESLFISRKTAETHRRVVLRKLNLRNTTELIKFAARNHLLDP